MTNYSRGAAYERKVKKEYEEAGFLVIRSAGSKGPVDLVAIYPGFDQYVVLIQCKLRKPTAAERRKAVAFVKEFGLTIELRWPNGQEVISA